MEMTRTASIKLSRENAEQVEWSSNPSCTVARREGDKGSPHVVASSYSGRSTLHCHYLILTCSSCTVFFLSV
jgi:uncharacterized Fe-S radical SAM superfamily protein PflX